MARPRLQWPYVLAAVALTAGLLTIVQIVVRPPMLLAERFFPGTGWLELAVLAAYAGFVMQRMLEPRRSARWRQRIWTLFTVVFFVQLALGLMGYESFLMTGKLHLPVPALIVGGPVYRGGGLFMLILLASTLVLVGPAWCSHLCYIGAWDDIAARRRKAPSPLPRWRWVVRPLLLVLVIATAALLRVTGAPSWLAFALALGLGLAGVAVMVLLSRRAGAMVHCVAYCPIGFVTNVLGRISPFRLRIAESCTACGVCRRACRFDALRDEDIERRRPGAACTLCGDCLSTCHAGSLQLRFPGLGPTHSRALFLVLVVSLHAATLGLARI